MPWPCHGHAYMCRVCGNQCSLSVFTGTAPRMVIESKGGSLFSADHMKAICAFEDKYVRPHMAFDCPAQTLPFYIGSLRNKDCSELDDQDIDATMNLLRQCSAYYLNGSLSYKCGYPGACPEVPIQCTQGGVAYNILHYLVDIDFLQGLDPYCNKLSYTMLFFPPSWNYSEHQLQEYFLDHLEGRELGNDLVHVKGMELNLGHDVFPMYVAHDMPFYILAMALVILLLLMYLRSWLMMVAVLSSVGCSLIVSYVVYFDIFRVGFFPFLNLIAGLLIIGITADDVFILYDIWQKVRMHQPDLATEDVMRVTLHHGALSIVVTSFTTAAALFANLVSDITCVRCFSIFAGICVLVNCAVMLTAVPALIAIAETTTIDSCPGISSIKFLRTLDKKSREAAQSIWHKFVPMLVTRFWPLWVGVFSLIGIGGVVVVFIHPTLELPSSAHIRFFEDGQPFEVYNLDLREHFNFEVDSRARRLDVQWLFGVDGVDRGSSMNPDDRGSLSFDDNFDIFEPESQEWHLEFCQNLLEQDFVLTPSKYQCLLEQFKDLVTSPCVKDMPLACCNMQFPLETSQAKTCLMNETFQSLLFSRKLMGNIIEDAEGNVRVLQYYVPTVHTWSASHPVMDMIYNNLKYFTDHQLEDAPTGAKGGWFSSARLQFQFRYYDLQNELGSSSYVGLVLALGIGFVVLLMTSLNLLLTFYATLTIVLVIATTMAALVLQGWKLNVSESLTITLTVGLSIDFTIHCGIAYKVSQALTRESRVFEALSTVGSAVMMAGLTTFAAGAALVPFATVLAFERFGIFLMIVMVVSVTFAVFFFLSLCTVIGPMGSIGDFAALFKRVFSIWRKTSKPHEPATISLQASHCTGNGKVADGKPPCQKPCLADTSRDGMCDSEVDV